MARRVGCLLLAALLLRGTQGNAANPVTKVISMLGSLEMKIIKDGQEEQKTFEAFMDWCKNGAKDKEFEIKTAKSSIADLKATIEKADADILTMSSRIDDLAGSLSVNEGDLKAATQIREKEHSEFSITEQELVDSIDTLERAINILERKLRGSNLLQAKVERKDIRQLIRVLGTVIDAAAMSLHDKQKLLGLVQNKEAEEEEEDEDALGLGAPQADAYESHSDSIVDVLENLKQKAVAQLEEARREETNARHNFDLLKQSITDQMKVDNKQLSNAKGAKHDASETKSISQGDLAVTEKSLNDAENVLKNMKGDCTTKASDHEISTSNRAEELKALAAAKKAIMEMTGGAANFAYNSTSFLQLAADGSDGMHQKAQLQTRADLANFEVVNLVRKLAREQKSTELAQLAQRISATMNSASGADPFVKIRGMIQDMIARLTADAGAEAEHKAYCDKEYSETKQKLDELKYDIEKYSSKIDKAKADSATLKDEVATLHSEIAEITKVQTEADALRKKEHQVYVEATANLKQGLSGVRLALKLLRDYYSNQSPSLVQQPDMPDMHSKAMGSGTGVIAMLEVVESDFGKSLASTEVNEEAAATAYEKLSMESRVSVSLKQKDIEYKSKEAVALDKTSKELDSDRNSAQTELDAVLQYSSKIRAMCEVKPESYEERSSRRQAEIAGLREALQILEGEGMLLQEQNRGQRRSLRIHR